MIRFLCRSLATVFFAAAVLAGLLDASRTVANDAIVMTPLGEDLERALPDLLVTLRGSVADWPMLPTALEGALALPGWAVFGALALIFAILGHRPVPRHRRVLSG